MKNAVVDATEADRRAAREIVKATLTPEDHRRCNCREKIDAGLWDGGQKVRAALVGIYFGRGQPVALPQAAEQSSDGPFEAMIYDADLPSMTARFRIPEPARPSPRRALPPRASARPRGRRHPAACGARHRAARAPAIASRRDRGRRSGASPTRRP